MDETRLEIADTVAVVALAVVMTFEAIDAGNRSVLSALNWVLFVLIAAVFAARWRAGIWARLTPTWQVIEVALLVVSLPLLSAVGPIRLLRLVRLPLLGAKRGRSMREKLIDRGPLLVGTTAIALWFTASLFILEFEKGNHSGGSFEGLTDALWWSATTMTTVGYGDLAPETFGGRVTAVVLMVLGISLFGLVTALLANWLRGAKPEDEPATKADIAEVLELLGDRR